MDSQGADMGLLLMRAVVGTFMFAHGAQKLFGWFNGSGLAGTREMVRRKGLRPTWLWATTAAISMTGGGAATALGAMDPLGPVGIIASMLTVATLERTRPFFAHRGGNELAYVYLGVGVALALTGPGAYSLDMYLGMQISPMIRWASIATAASALVALHASRAGREAGAVRT